jgi:hypothetical protein
MAHTGSGRFETGRTTQNLFSHNNQLTGEEDDMLGDRLNVHSDSGGLGMNCEYDPLQLVGRPDLRAGMQAQRASIQNCANDRLGWQRLLELADANTKKRLEEETERFTRLEF